LVQGDNLGDQIGYLVGDGHVALLLGNAGDRADVSDLRSRLTLDDGERGLGLDNLPKMSELFRILLRIVCTANRYCQDIASTRSIDRG
jgi:hypothetical protein